MSIGEQPNAQSLQQIFLADNDLIEFGKQWLHKRARPLHLLRNCANSRAYHFTSKIDAAEANRTRQPAHSFCCFTIWDFPNGDSHRDAWIQRWREYVQNASLMLDDDWSTTPKSRLSDLTDFADASCADRKRSIAQ